MSQWGEVCDHISADLKANVPALADAVVHTRVTWDPSELRGRKKERHLAVWPAPETAAVEPLAIGSHRIREAFGILYWEWAADQTRRGREDEVAVERMFKLHDAVVTRLYSHENQRIPVADGSGTWKVWYDSSALPERIGDFRSFGVGFTTDRAKAFEA